MKYIMIESGLHGVYPVVFPDMIDHDVVARGITAIYPGDTAESAGFCNVQGSTWGKSKTLNMEPSPDDEYFLKKLFENNS